jgi:hypothetical protein
MIPQKALVVMLTTPNNDNGDCIVGYRDELPDQWYQLHKASEGVKSTQSFWSFRRMRYHLDYKKLLGVFKGVEVKIISGENEVYSDFKILKNGSSAS